MNVCSIILGLTIGMLSSGVFNDAFATNEGQGRDSMYEEAARWWTKPHYNEQERADALRNLGRVYGNENDRKDRVLWYKEAAEQGDHGAQYMLGYMYENGLCVKQDYKKAFEWYRKAAEQGRTEAQYALGHMYEEGFGVEQDYKKAFAWYKNAANNGFPEAKEALERLKDKV